MTDQPRKTTSSFKDLQLEAGKTNQSLLSRFRSLLFNSKTFLPLLGGFLLIFSGLTLVSITILGIISPLWISAMLTLVGSISSMVGVFLLYQVVTSKDTFESLINKAIRRVINSQN